MAEYSPMMQHYLETKEKYSDCILFYRLGDFYEMFFEDAKTAARELELTLTGKDCGKEERAPMAGIPFHAAESYISKLIEKGYKVAICEQLEDPKQAKGIVKRDVIRVVTPGTVIETNMLDEKKNNYIMSIFKKGIYFGIAVCDVTTGDFYASHISEDNNFASLVDEISKYNPAEIIVNSLLFESNSEITEIKKRFSAYINKLPEETFKEESKELLENYTIRENGKKLESLDKYLLEVSAINALLDYLNQTQKIKLEHINLINIYSTKKYMSLDITARRNLELTERMQDKSKKGTLLWVLDKTSTSMGGRLLRRWINEPLIDVNEINKRLDAVEELKNNIILRGEIINNLKYVYDIERLVGKIAYGNCNARDLVSLKSSLKQLPGIKNMLEVTNSNMLKELYSSLDVCEDLYTLIENAIVEEPPIAITEGGIIKRGFNEEVDELKKQPQKGKIG